MKAIRALGIALAASSAAAAQDKPSPPAGGVNEVAVDRAIKKGIEYLRTAPSPDLKGGYQNSDELILYTFIHAGVPETDPKFRELFGSVTTQPLRRTYKVVLLAMCLEAIDRVKYQEKIAQCAQFLVDNQCRNGQWSYGNAVESAQKDVRVPELRAEAPTPGAKPPAAKARAPKVTIKKTAEGPETGDNSNSQYAALGLRACHDANVTVPKEAIEQAIKAWKESQYSEAMKAKDGKPRVASGVLPEGWNYKADDMKPPYQAMTAGAVGSLVIYDYILGRDWKKDPLVKSGMAWLTEKFEIQLWNGYSMYALERAGVLYGTETFGTRWWYREGANGLIGTQAANGSWGKDSEDWHGLTWDTCFSILFLRRATRPLVASEVKK
jgi:hypothetical protein